MIIEFLNWVTSLAGHLLDNFRLVIYFPYPFAGHFVQIAFGDESGQVLRSKPKNPRTQSMPTKKQISSPSVTDQGTPENQKPMAETTNAANDLLSKRTRKKIGAQRQKQEKRPSQKSVKKVVARASRKRAGTKVRSASSKKKAAKRASARGSKRGK
jgi:hypothetical protein